MTIGTRDVHQVSARCNDLNAVCAYAGTAKKERASNQTMGPRDAT